jgi:Rrf2 family transcriptional regulator, iron-sulfur cluster assembly transcription factor
MKLTTRGHYSVKALLDLSLQPAGQISSVSAISARQSLPAPYLEKLLIELRRSHLVSSVRGAHGGYRLAKAPAQISLGQILEAVGESTSALASGMTRPMASDPLSSGAEDWVTSMLWQRLQQKLKEAFYSITLEDLYYDARSWQAAQGEGASFVV